ncbi:tripartite tricarboxylate transporter permease [Paralimibaculum aggregatum]|uniref:Tripartite tricarboxylate transporter permease n=1 Tax=Paralimibaculum aggregatum TaxID=3036245 RepID=A0ABQ6LS06_9RHOB|nr:tripartite tricarboxylate transporter permease [Limibaculum sp. NKW23]GMG84280.1 tripartite tricarboxylate transporter permease [Limibaculum sp. NKW23]
METFGNLAFGFDVAFSWSNLLYCLVGVVLGTFVGVLPGLGAVTAISMLLPFTFGLEPLGALIMLSGIFYGGLYGGSTASILLNLPGTPASAVAAMDGYPMAQQGRAGVPLFMTAIASFAGGCAGLMLVAVAAPAIVSIALEFGPAEYFSMMLLGLLAAAAAASRSFLRSVGMVVVGLLLGLVGTDIVSGMMRFTFGVPIMAEGISFIVVAMAMFGLSEVMRNLEPHVDRALPDHGGGWRSMMPTRDEARRSVGAILRGTGLGAFLGALPGAGPTISSFMAYAVETRVAADPSRFGKGAIEGVTAPEAANNAAAQTGYIPTLTLGIPGDAVGALILGTLIMHGISPGPRVISAHPELFWGLIASMWIGNFLLLWVNIPFIGVWVKILSIPYRILYPMIVIFLCIGVYSVANSSFQLVLLAGLGAAGYLLAKLDCPASPLLLGLILGPMMEENLRRALLIGRGDPVVFFETPISAGILALCGILILASLVSSLRRARNRQGAA